MRELVDQSTRIHTTEDFHELEPLHLRLQRTCMPQSINDNKRLVGRE